MDVLKFADKAGNVEITITTRSDGSKAVWARMLPCTTVTTSHHARVHYNCPMTAICHKALNGKGSHQ